MPLGQIATVEQVDVQGSITRIDESPAAQITAEIASEDTGAVSQEVALGIDALEANGTIPDGVESPSRVSPSSRTRRSAACSCRWRSRS